MANWTADAMGNATPEDDPNYQAYKLAMQTLHKNNPEVFERALMNFYDSKQGNKPLELGREITRVQAVKDNQSIGDRATDVGNALFAQIRPDPAWNQNAARYPLNPIYPDRPIPAYSRKK